jgi:hypothetical protein
LTGQKNQKPLAAIIIPPICCTDDSARAESIAAGMHRQIKAKKQNRPGGLSWIHSDAPAVYTASESVLWSRKYCLTESGRRGSLFPRRPFATFGPAKVGPRQRLAGDSFQERNQCSPLLSPSRNRLPAPSACRFSRLNIALFKGISFHKPGQALTAVRVEPTPGKNADRRLGLICLFKKRNGREKNSLPSPAGGVLLTGQKNQKPLAAIIIPPIRWTDDSVRAARLAAGMHRQIKAKKQSRPGGLSWIHSDAPAANGASESVLWSRKYCLTESGRRGSLFPRRPFATFGPAKVGPRQRRRGVFQSPRRSSPLHFPLRNRLPAPSACRFSRLNIALF